MHNETALSAIAENAGMFADQLTRLDPAKTKTLRLPSKFAFFQGGSAYHRVAVICPLTKGLPGEQQLLAGLIWANKVSNGQKTILYMVGEKFAPQIGYMLKLFGPRVEVRLAYYTPKLRSPFFLAGREPGTQPPRYQLPMPKDQLYWERRFNPVEQGWLRTALEYFSEFAGQGVRICFLENWISIKFKGLEVVRINKRENRLRVALITRYPREVPGVVSNREEIEGWFNAEGILNSEFKLAYTERIGNLTGDTKLFARICPDQHYMAHLLMNTQATVGIRAPLFDQLDVNCKGDSPLTIDLLGRTEEGNLLTMAIHPHKDLLGFGRSLAQLVWAQTQLLAVKSNYFNSNFVADPVAWLICDEKRIHPDLEVLQSLMTTPVRIRLVVVNNDWAETGITNLKGLGEY